MLCTPSINPRIVEALYADTLVLADEVRCAFDSARREGEKLGVDDLARVALSCEALRTTTRVMHCLAWLLNHRAFFAGELSEIQLRRHGRLVASVSASDPDNCALLTPAMFGLVQESERIYARIERLERAWRSGHENQGADGPSAIERLRERLALAMRAG
jgi:regulator of CtrA degradation